MKSAWILLGVLAVAVLASIECASPAQDGGDRFANLIARARPTAEHHVLDDLAGEFSVETHFSLPSEAESTWSGATSNSWILGGRYLECRAKSSRGPVEVESLRLLGYEPSTHQYTASTFESLSLSHVDARGTFDASTKALVLKSGDREPLTEVLRIVDRDHYAREIWGNGAAGQPIQLVRASYSRVNAK